MQFFVLVALMAGLAHGEKYCGFDFIGNHMKLGEKDVLITSVICEECMAIKNLTLLSLKTVEIAHSSDDVHDDVKCYYACYFKSYGSMNANGDFLPAAVTTTLSERNYVAASDCIPEALVHENHCDRAYHLYRCYVNKPIDALVRIDDIL